jgi:hypothetical protein
MGPIEAETPPERAARRKTKERSCNIGNGFKERNGSKPGVEWPRVRQIYTIFYGKH